MSITLG